MLTDLQTLASDIIKRDYEVTFLTGEDYRDSIETIGAEFVPLGDAGPTLQDWAEMATPEAKRFTGFQLDVLFFRKLAPQWQKVQEVLGNIAMRSPGKKVVVLQDYTISGLLPTFLGGQGLKPLAVISIGITPYSLTSENGETPPFWKGIQYDPSPEGRQRNVEATLQRNKNLAHLNDRFSTHLAAAGVSWEGDFFWDSISILPDRFIQMSIPALEYPQSFPENFRWGGPIPRGPPANFTPPTWWDDVIQTSKPVIMVCEGTIPGLTFSNLIQPTMEALVSEDVLVVAILGSKGAALLSDAIIPANARVIDHILYDSVLEHADVFVTNGGNGGFQQALSHGVPMVIAGEAQEKAEVAWRGDYAGVALNLKTERPPQDEIRSAVRKVLTESRFRARAKQIQKEMQTYDAFDIVAANIEELSAE